MTEQLMSALLRRLPPALGRRLSFVWRYRRGQVPWDTNQTPPEVIEALASHAGPPGRALDLGCGTGTNTLYLAQLGWEAWGVDYVAQAVKEARAKAQATMVGHRAHFLQGDVTRLETLPLAGPFGFVLDIGCLHSLPDEGQGRYAAGVARLAAPGAPFLLYAGRPRAASVGTIGIAPERVAALFAPHFAIERQEQGTDSEGGWPRVWYWMRRV